MAGSSSPYNVDNVTFSTLAAAVTQIIADEDGNDTNEEIVIAYTFSTSETVTLPTRVQVQTTGQFPLRIDGDSATTLTGYILFGASGVEHFRLTDVIISGSGANFNINGATSFGNQHLSIENCVIDNTSNENIGEVGSVYATGTSFGNTSAGENIGRCARVALYECKMNSATGNVMVDGGNTSVYMENCACRSTGSSNVHMDTGVGVSFVANNCTFTQATAVYESDCTVGQHENVVQMKGCIFDNFTHVMHFTNAAESDVIRVGKHPVFTRDCIVSNQTGTAYLSMLNTSQQMTLAALQTAGMDSNSKAFNVTFTSTTLSSADFLKHDSGDDADLLFVDPTGVNTDFFGTARTSGPISAGIFEPSAVSAGAARVWGAGSGPQTTAWNTGTNWTGDTVPSSLDDVTYDGTDTTNCIIDAAVNVKSITATSAYTGTFDNATNDQNITVSNDVILACTRVDMGDATWAVSGNWDNKDVTTFNENSSTLVMDGSGNMITGFSDNKFDSVTISGTITIVDASMVINNVCNVSGALTINSGQRIRLIGTLGDLQIESTGKVTGAGEVQINNEGSITKQDGTLDTAQLNILKAHHTNPQL